MTPEQEAAPEFVEIQVEHNTTDSPPQTTTDPQASNDPNDASALHFEAVHHLDQQTETQLSDVISRSLVHSPLASFLLSLGDTAATPTTATETAQPSFPSSSSSSSSSTSLSAKQMAARLQHLRRFASWLLRTADRFTQTPANGTRRPFAFILYSQNQSQARTIRAVALALPTPATDADSTDSSGGGDGDWDWDWWPSPTRVACSLPLLMRFGPTCALRIYSAWDHMQHRWARLTPSFAGRYLPLLCVDPAFHRLGLMRRLLAHIAAHPHPHPHPHSHSPAQSHSPLWLEVQDSALVRAIPGSLVDTIVYSEETVAGPLSYLISIHQQ